MLVMGFGPFGEVHDNPARRLALEVDGLVVGGRPVVGREMSVSWRGCLAETLHWVQEVDPSVVLGLGVAVGRPGVSVERIGRRQVDARRRDALGARMSELEAGGPELVLASPGVEVLAMGLGAELSEDAGGYVCNAWLYQAMRAVGTSRRVGFVHLPVEGILINRLIDGLSALSELEGADG